MKSSEPVGLEPTAAVVRLSPVVSGTVAAPAMNATLMSRASRRAACIFVFTLALVQAAGRLEPRHALSSRCRVSSQHWS